MRARGYALGLAVLALVVAVLLVMRERTGISSREQDSPPAAAAPTVQSLETPLAAATRTGAHATERAADGGPAATADADADLVPMVPSPPGGFGVEVTLSEERSPRPAGVPLRLEVRAAGNWRGERWDATTDREGVARFGPFPAPRIPRGRARDACLVLWSPIDSGVGLWSERFVYRMHLLGEARGGWGAATLDAATGVRWIRIYETATRGVRVSGRVVDGADRPLAAVHVDVDTSDRFGLEPGIVTDDDGAFSLRVAAPGRLAVRLKALWRRDGVVTLREDTLDVPAEGLVGCVLRVPSVSSISGVVKDSRGRAVAGLALVLDETLEARFGELSFGTTFRTLPAPLLDQRALTGPDGRFWLPLASNDTADLELAVDDGRGRSRPVLSPLGPPRDDITLLIDPHGVRPLARDPESGAPVLAEIEVFAPKDAKEPRRHSIGWDDRSPVEDGTMVEPGTEVRIVARADGYAVAEATHRVSEAVGFDVVELRMARPTGRTTVRLRYVDPDGKPLPWPRVQFTQGAAGTLEVLGEVIDGEFVTRALAPGRYEVAPKDASALFDRETFAGAPSDGPWRLLTSAPFRFEVGSDGDVSHVVRARRGGALRMSLALGERPSLGLWWDVERVRDGRAAPLALFEKARYGRWLHAYGFHEGEFESEALEPGRWTLRWKGFDGSEWVPRERDVIVEEGQILPLTIEVDESRR